MLELLHPPLAPAEQEGMEAKGERGWALPSADSHAHTPFSSYCRGETAMAFRGSDPSPSIL